MWRSGSVTRGVAQLASARLLQTAITTVGSVAIARILGPSGRGVYATAFSLTATGVLVLTFGAPSAVSWATARQAISGGQILRICGAAVISVLTGLTAVVLLLRAVSVSETYDRLPALPILLLGIAMCWGSLLSSLLTGSRLYRLSASAVAWVAILGVPLSVAAAAMTRDPGLTLMGTVAGSVVVYAWLSRRLHRRGLHVDDAGRSSIHRRELRRFALISWTGNLIQNVNFRLDILLLGLWRDPGEVGFYAVAVGIAQFLWMLPSAAGEVMFAESASRSNASADREAVLRTIQRRMSGVLLLTLCGAGLMAAISEPLVVHLLGSEFSPSVSLLRWLLPGVAGFSLVQVGGNALAGLGHPGTNTAIAGTAAVLTVTGNLLFIERWGATAAAAVTSSSYLVSGLLTVAVVRFYLRDAVAARVSDHAEGPP